MTLKHKMKEMKKFRVIYLPHGREDKEWMYFTATSEADVIKRFASGIILRIEEEDED
jgi:hypothetical protein